MDDVVLNDIPSASHAHYIQGRDWIDLAIILGVAAAVFFLIMFISRRLERKGIIDKWKSQWKTYWKGFRIRHAAICRASQIIGKILLNIIVAFVCFDLLFIPIGIVADVFDRIWGIDNTYRKIVYKKHYLSRDDIYDALNFTEPEVPLDTVRVEEYIFSADSVPDKELRDKVDSLYRTLGSDNPFVELHYLSSMNGFPPDIQDFFYKQALLRARDKYETLNPILQKCIVDDDLDGMLAVDSLAMGWKWELGIYDRRYKPQDFLRTKSLYYAIQLIERDFPVNDSTARKLFDYACEGIETSARMVGYETYLCLFFQDVRARYAYQLNNPKAGKYTDRFIGHSRRWESFLSSRAQLFSPDRGGDVPGYYNRFFTDPLYLRYKTLLKKKKYKKAALALEAMSSSTEEISVYPDNPYWDINDTLQVMNMEAGDEMLAFAKYNLASISENARVRRLRRNKEADGWLVGAFLSGVRYLSPTESILASLGEYAFEGGLYFPELIPYMAVNYNNSDSRWVYNTALFLKGTGAVIAPLMEDAVLSSGNDSLKALLGELKTERVFARETAADDRRFGELDSLLRETLGYRIKSVLSECFYSYLDVQKGLSGDECAVEIVKVPSLEFSDDRYRAVVLRKDSPSPVIVNLALASAVNGAISSGNLYGSGADKLYALIWKPLERFVKPHETVYIAPDGALCSVNIGALSDKNDRRLMDTYDIRQCVSTKDVLKRDGTGNHSSIALFGGIVYDAAEASASPTQARGDLVAYRGVDCDARGEGWSYLPGTRMEVESIDSTASGSGAVSSLFTGGNATEYRFKALSGEDVGILHIATHGFYYNRAMASDLTFFEKMVSNDNPLNRCGLIMAGGQRAWAGEELPASEEDGILLGSEIARMDLTSVDIAVLSACNTGLGDVTYEGVSGLQRAFKQAGVNNIVMTLSEVSDDATRQLMEYFYDALFKGGSARDSFDYAIAQMKDSQAYSDPKYWAPFILLD